MLDESRTAARRRNQRAEIFHGLLACHMLRLALRT
jgi:hypothetical protein